MSKHLCDISKCHAVCCYNIPMEKGYLSAYRKKIINPVIRLDKFQEVDNYDRIKINGQRMQYLVITNDDLNKNKCPFLREDCRCNIYSNRPSVCRKFGVTPDEPALRCKFICGQDPDLSDKAWLEGVMRTKTKLLKRGIKLP